MTEREVLKLMTALAAAYPARDITEATIQVYTQHLVDLPFKEAEAAVQAHILTGKWFPTIAEIRRAVVEASCDAPDPGEAWEEVWGALQRYGIARPLPAWSHPLVEKAVHALGYRNLYESENPAADRARFMEIYERYREGYMRDRQVGLPPTKKPFALKEHE